MSTPHIIMWAIVVCVGLPSAYRNPTALALGLSWLMGELTWMATGNNLPLSVYICADITVIAVICAKAIYREGCHTYPTLRTQFACFWRSQTMCDRLIVAIFLLGSWPAYVIDIHPFYRWYLLWGLTISQFLLSGAEALLGYFHRDRPPKPDSSNILQFAPAYSRRAHKVFGAEHRPLSATLLAKRAGGDG